MGSVKYMPPINPTPQQLANRLNPTPVTLPTPSEGQVYGSGGANGGVYSVKDGKMYFTAAQEYTKAGGDLSKIAQISDSQMADMNRPNNGYGAGISLDSKSPNYLSYFGASTGNTNMQTYNTQPNTIDPLAIKASENATKIQLAGNPQPNTQQNPQGAPTGTPPTPTGQPASTNGAPAVLPPATALQPGNTGPAVQQLQNYLVSKGLMTAQDVATGPGIYGPKTTAAVAALQSQLGVDNSTGVGYFGPKTMAAINAKTTGGPGSGITSDPTQSASPPASSASPTDKYANLDPVAKQVAMYQDAYKSLGLDTIKQKFDEYTKQESDLTNEMNQKMQDTQNNPWLSQSVVDRTNEKIKNSYTAKLDTLAHLITLSDSLYKQGQAQVTTMVSNANADIKAANELAQKQLDAASALAKDNEVVSIGGHEWLVNKASGKKLADLGPVTHFAAGGSAGSGDASQQAIDDWTQAVLGGNATMVQVPANIRTQVAHALNTVDSSGDGGSYSPLAASRFTIASNRIVSNFINLPGYSLTANGLPYLQRIDAAMKTPGSVSDQDLLDSLTKLNTSGNAITDAQVKLVTGGRSFADSMSVFGNKLGNGGVLSDNQRQQIQQIAQAIYANYAKGYQPIYDQVAAQLTAANIPKQFWTIPDLNNLSAKADGASNSSDTAALASKYGI